MSSDVIDEHFTVWSKRIGLILLGWFGSSLYHGTMDLDRKAAVLEKVQRVDIPKLKAAVHCEDTRADKATAVAHKAIRGALVDAAPIPSTSEIPADNCPHPPVK